MGRGRLGWYRTSVLYRCVFYNQAKTQYRYFHSGEKNWGKSIKVESGSQVGVGGPHAVVGSRLRPYKGEC